MVGINFHVDYVYTYKVYICIRPKHYNKVIIVTHNLPEQLTETRSEVQRNLSLHNLIFTKHPPMLSNSNSNMVAPPKTSYYKGLGDNWEQQNAGGEESPEFFTICNTTTTAAVTSLA